VWGCLLPLLLLAIVRLCSLNGRGSLGGRYGYLFAWFAGFCLIANGAYLTGGALIGRGADDAGVILQYGGARWQLVAFGLPVMALGLYLWSGLGRHFGLGSSGEVDRKATAVVTAAFLLILAAEVLLGVK
jgi:hypothetical protein